MAGRNPQKEGRNSSNNKKLTYKEIDAYDERLYNLFIRVYRMAELAEEFEDAKEQIEDEIENTLTQCSGYMKSVTNTLIDERRNLDMAKEDEKKPE